MAEENKRPTCFGALDAKDENCNHPTSGKCGSYADCENATKICIQLYEKPIWYKNMTAEQKMKIESTLAKVNIATNADERSRIPKPINSPSALEDELNKVIGGTSEPPAREPANVDAPKKRGRKPKAEKVEEPVEAKIDQSQQEAAIVETSSTGDDIVVEPVKVNTEGIVCSKVSFCTTISGEDVTIELNGINSNDLSVAVATICGRNIQKDNDVPVVKRGRKAKEVKEEKPAGKKRGRKPGRKAKK